LERLTTSAKVAFRSARVRNRGWAWGASRIVDYNGMRQSWLAAKPAYELLGALDRLCVNWADRPHGMVQGDWDAMLAVADRFLLGRPIDRQFDQFPAQPAPAP
jgi:hypothetical protein